MMSSLHISVCLQGDQCHSVYIPVQLVCPSATFKLLALHALLYACIAYLMPFLDDIMCSMLRYIQNFILLAHNKDKITHAMNGPLIYFMTQLIISIHFIRSAMLRHCNHCTGIVFQLPAAMREVLSS
uniref:Uncharacterized protein n=1 Tax=Oryza rufipogon TaxID=4529 RepID=A0A0E0P2B8_ORYRU